MQEAAPYIPPFVRRLMKDATEQQMFEATERLRCYLAIMYSIFLELEAKKAGTDSKNWTDDDTLVLGLFEPHEL